MCKNGRNGPQCSDEARFSPKVVPSCLESSGVGREEVGTQGMPQAPLPTHTCPSPSSPLQPCSLRGAGHPGEAVMPFLPPSIHPSLLPPPPPPPPHPPLAAFHTPLNLVQGQVRYPSNPHTVMSNLCSPALWRAHCSCWAL